MADTSNLKPILVFRLVQPTAISPRRRRVVAARAERVASQKPRILPRYDPELQTFLEFVLAQYESQGMGELDQEKLPSLLELKYQTVNDAADALGRIPAIRDAFVGFQRYLYEP